MLYELSNDMMNEHAKTHYAELLKEAENERLLRGKRGSWWARVRHVLSLLLA